MTGTFFTRTRKKNFHQRSRITNSILLFLYSGLISRCRVKTYGQFKSTTEAQRVRTDLFETFQLLHRAAAFSKTLR